MIGFAVVVEVASERPQRGGDIGAGLSTLGVTHKGSTPFTPAVPVRSKAIDSALLLSSTP